jgi:hypothetical protein
MVISQEKQAHRHLLSFVNNGEIVLQFYGLSDQFADIFTKSLNKKIFDFQKQHLNITKTDFL